MIQDLHSHTYYSFCGKDDPEMVVQTAINGGVQLLGITDHNYGIGFCRNDVRQLDLSVLGNVYDNYALKKYYNHITLLKEKYANKINILRGIEIATTTSQPKLTLPTNVDVSFFDYALIEHIDYVDSIINGNLFAYVKSLGVKHVGLAHTDILSYIKSINEDALTYFKRMANENIFWEMNVNYDSIHGYKQHAYVNEFFNNEEQQRIVKESGVKLSVGFDGDKVEDYLPNRVAEYCNKIKNLGIKLVFEN